MVHVGLPGRWQWRVEFETPLTLHLALETAGEEQHWISDGESAAMVLGNTVIARERLADSDLLSVVQFLAVIGLDALRDKERFHTLELEPGDRAAPHVLAVTTRDESAAYYRLEFDERFRLVATEGPLTIPLIGGGRVRARFSDFRTVDARVLPFAIDYEVEGNLAIEERIVHLRARPEPVVPTR